MLLKRNPILWALVYRHNHPIGGFLLSFHAAGSAGDELTGTWSGCVQVCPWWGGRGGDMTLTGCGGSPVSFSRYIHSRDSALGSP